MLGRCHGDLRGSASRIAAGFSIIAMAQADFPRDGLWCATAARPLHPSVAYRGVYDPTMKEPLIPTALTANPFRPGMALVLSANSIAENGHWMRPLLGWTAPRHRVPQ